MSLKLGMVGGGRGAFIGGVHRIAARLDGHWELVAGAFSSDPTRAATSAAELGIGAERSYDSFAAMAKAEAARPDCIDAVAIVTPNHLHVPIATAFLRAGIPVICDKPLATTVEDAETLVRLVTETGIPFILTQTYTGYPMVREARALVAAGRIGHVRHVQVEFLQDWLAEPVERGGQKQAAWRADPAQSGAGGCIADIGTHAFNLATFVSGLVPHALLADLTAFVPGRALDDNAALLLRLPAGHPEGYLEAFATLYAEAAGMVRRFRDGAKPDQATLLPTVTDGLAGMRFISAGVRSHEGGAVWINL